MQVVRVLPHGDMYTLPRHFLLNVATACEDTPLGFEVRNCWCFYSQEVARAGFLPTGWESGVGIQNGAGPGHCALSHHQATALAPGTALSSLLRETCLPGPGASGSGEGQGSGGSGPAMFTGVCAQPCCLPKPQGLCVRSPCWQRPDRRSGSNRELHIWGLSGVRQWVPLFSLSCEGVPCQGRGRS